MLPVRRVSLSAGKYTGKDDPVAIVRTQGIRLKVQQKADEWRRQGFIGATMASQAELAYTGIVDTLAQLESEFTLREEPVTVG